MSDKDDDGDDGGDGGDAYCYYECDDDEHVSPFGYCREEVSRLEWETLLTILIFVPVTLSTIRRAPLLVLAMTNHLVRNKRRRLDLDTKVAVPDVVTDDAVRDGNDRPTRHRPN